MLGKCVFILYEEVFEGVYYWGGEFSGWVKGLECFYFYFLGGWGWVGGLNFFS